ncbi:MULTISPECIES: isoprenylcysteine carboxylmethyltransferase family protein [unclassified Aliiroseovarius]|uniref:methyltransferase family protein n=2 Tax=unclassified Aliiroseovarius TaxID=2623558 RepID=UPI00156821D4
MKQTMQLLDLPPVWLLGLLAGTYALHLALPQVGFGPLALPELGAVFIMLGIGLMLCAMWEFLRARTTIMPRATPTAFLQRGIYRFSRNPIYLGDALVLLGAVLWWNIAPAILFVPLFIFLINKRFIEGEEAGLRALYGAEFEEWSRKVRRWI